MTDPSMGCPGRYSACVSVLIVLALLGAPRSAHAEWVAAGFLGGAATHRAALEIEQRVRRTALEIENVSLAGRSLESPLYYGYRLMWAPTSQGRLGLEVEFIHLKVYADTGAAVRMHGVLRGHAIDGTRRLDDVVQRFAISHGLNLLLGNLVIRQPLARGPSSTGQLAFVGRLGAGPTIPHAETTVEGTTQEQYQWGRVAAQAAAGLEWRFARRLAAVAEYKLTATPQRVRIPDGTASATIISHHVVAGVAWRLG
jgi:hypothetical protein